MTLVICGSKKSLSMHKSRLSAFLMFAKDYCGIDCDTQFVPFSYWNMYKDPETPKNTLSAELARDLGLGVEQGLRNKEEFLGKDLDPEFALEIAGFLKESGKASLYWDD